MGEPGVVRGLVLEAERVAGNRSHVAEGAEIDNSQLSRFLSGEGALKLDALERIFTLAGAVVISKQEYLDTEAMLRGFARRLLKK
jgi:hypothetical protein